MSGQSPSFIAANAETPVRNDNMHGNVFPNGSTVSEEPEKRVLQDIDFSNPDFEVSFSSDADPRNPRSMSTLRKWMIVLIIASTSLCVACTSSLYIATYDQITVEFRCSEIVATLGLTMFVFGLGLSPMVLAPLSEVRHAHLRS